MEIDLTSVETQLLQALGIVLLAVLIAAARLLLAKLHIQLSAAQKAELDDAADKALTYGITQATDEIKAKGWDHVDVKNAVVATAATYAVKQFPQTLKSAGINPADPAIAAEKLSGVLQRKFPDAATAAVASPVTPPASAPTATKP